MRRLEQIFETEVNTERSRWPAGQTVG